MPFYPPSYTTWEGGITIFELHGKEHYQIQNLES